jgi:hypothetical protein
LNGTVNGNIGVAKSIIAELTDETNIARGFSMLPLAAAIGQIIGYGILPKVSSFPRSYMDCSPFIGGVLSRPQDRWPGIFSHHFWLEYPYFLPCLVVAALSLLQFIITALFLKEVGSLLLLCGTRLTCFQDSQKKSITCATAWDRSCGSITGRKWNGRYTTEGR